VLPADWKRFTTDNIGRAQQQLAKSISLREEVDATLKVLCLSTAGIFLTSFIAHRSGTAEPSQHSR
jgi:hypothetical protein